MSSSAPTRALAMITVAAGLLLAAPSGVGTAAAHGVPTHSPGGEAGLRAYETRVLGPEHAAEHAAERAAERRAVRKRRRMSPAKRKRLRARAKQNQRAMELAAGPPSQDGEWTTAPFSTPNFAIHAVMLPTGKILFFGYPPFDGVGERPNIGLAALWDPALGTGPGSMKEVPPPMVDVDGDGDLEPAPLYCSAQSLLPDGEVLVAGGNLIWPGYGVGRDYTSYAGMKRVFTFSPWTETWTEQPQMEHGRWYPSEVELADGRMAILGGFNETAPGGLFNDQLEIFTPGANPGSQGSILHEASGDRTVENYPHLFTLPTGDVLLAGPGSADSAILDTQAFTWSDLPDSSHTRIGGNVVLDPETPAGSSTVTEIGGAGTPDPPSTDTGAASASTESLDAAAPVPSWHAGPSLNVARFEGNTVQLPDGSMVMIGGGSGYTEAEGSWTVYPDHRSRQIELYDPGTESWRLGPPQQEDRTYHSTALLLPDGRVYSSGDDHHPTNPDGSTSTTDTAEIYSPPYLFKGPRPQIAAAPAELGWGDDFGIASASPGLASAVLVAPGAVTHAVDMHQRLVPLQLLDGIGGKGLNVASPASPAVAPPGYYMLFLLDSSGVPSIARWVRLRPDAPDQPTVSRDSAIPSGAGKSAVWAASECDSVRSRLRKAHSHKAKRRLRRKLRSLGC